MYQQCFQRSLLSFRFFSSFSSLSFSSLPFFFLGGSSLTRLFRRQFADVIPLLGAQGCVKNYAGAEIQGAFPLPQAASRKKLVDGLAG